MSQLKQKAGHHDHDRGSSSSGGGDEKTTTRVDGKGLWRSWKRNFKTKLLALLDLIDNALDAGIHGVGNNNTANGNNNGDHHNHQNDSNDNDNTTNFVGRVHVYPDIHESTTTGLCIVNNCKQKIRPLEKVLEVYNSSKVNSGAGDIGENGVGLKQGCATLSDLSFVLVKNGSYGSGSGSSSYVKKNIELGICAESLQREEGCYLPAFNFINEKGEDKESPSLKEQMILHFSKPKHADVARCIAQYGAASSTSDPNLILGIERLVRHFDRLCYSNQFANDPYVFLVLIDKVHHGHSEEYVRKNWDAQQKITVHQLMKKLREEIPRTYLHVPDSFDFTIGGKKMEFKYWPERLVELSAFTVNVNSKIPWHQKMDATGEHPSSYELRVFIGFDGLRITDSCGGKEGSLYVYSRQSGRLISHHPDARTRLGLSAGGSTFCQGLTIIIDDIGGNLPLNPTKQEVAFGEEDNGAMHEENLMAWIGSVTHFFYHFHLKKCNDKKTVLTTKITKFGDIVLQKHRQLKTLDSSHLTTYELSFKSIGKSIRADKSSANQILGADTLYRLGADRSRTTAASASTTGATRRKRKTTKDDVIQPSTPPKIPRRRQPIAYNNQAESESDEDTEGSKGNPSNSAAKRSKRNTTKKNTIQPSNPPTNQQRRQPISHNAAEAGSDEDTGGSISGDSDPSTIQPAVKGKEHTTEDSLDNSCANPNDAEAGQINNNHDDEDSEEDPCDREFFRDLCGKLTQKTNNQKAQIKSLKTKLAREEQLRKEMQEQLEALKRKINDIEK